MTEQNWLTSQDPTAMLRFLQRTQGVTDDPFGNCPIRISNRKLRLFLCACVRELWKRDSVDPDEKVEKCIVVAERFADGKASKKELINRAHLYLDLESSHFPGWILAYFATLMDLDTIWSQGYTTDPFLHPPTQAALLREIVGNPFRPVRIPYQKPNTPPVYWCPGDPAILHEDAHCPFLTMPILHMARSIYEERDWEALPLLADMLEEAGCDCQELLHHFRGEECGLCSATGKRWYCKSCRGVYTILSSGKFCPCCGPRDLIPRACEDCGGQGRIYPLHCRGCAFLDTLLNLT